MEIYTEFNNCFVMRWTTEVSITVADNFAFNDLVIIADGAVCFAVVALVRHDTYLKFVIKHIQCISTKISALKIIFSTAFGVPYRLSEMIFDEKDFCFSSFFSKTKQKAFTLWDSLMSFLVLMVPLCPFFPHVITVDSFV